MKDPRKLFDVVTCGRSSQERRLGIDIASARQRYRRYVMSCIGFVRGSDNTADDLKKAGGNGALKRIMETGFDGTPVEKWVVRENGDEGCEKSIGVGIPGVCVKDWGRLGECR